MRRYHVQRALRAADLSTFAQGTFLAGVTLVVTAIVAALVGHDAGGVGRVIGLVGLAGILVCAISRGVRLYRASMTSPLPSAVVKVHVGVRPARGFGVITVALALGLPLAAGVVAITFFDSGWLLIGVVLLVGCAGALVTWVREAGGEWSPKSSAAAAALLDRLCMRADMRPPDLVVEQGAVARAWTARGRIHVTSSLLGLLDDAEVEAVLAHEVAHLARRDAAVMEISSTPSRVLLAFVRFLVPRLGRWTRKLLVPGLRGLALVIWFVAALCVPPA
jgi:Zn-dependent protease with chaperone function